MKGNIQTGFERYISVVHNDERCPHGRDCELREALRDAFFAGASMVVRAPELFNENNEEVTEYALNRVSGHERAGRSGRDH
jgi:hypothetical protein